MGSFPGIPPDGSAHGPEIDLLIALVHWFILALFLVWLVYFLYALVKFRASGREKADYHGPKARWFFVSVGAVIIVELILDFGFSIPIWTARVEGVPAEEDATVIRIVAEQYVWNIHYPGTDGIFGTTMPDLVETDNPLGLDRSDPAAADDIVTVNRLNVPVGRPVLIYLSSKDVIHSLNLPAFRIKQDAVPGLSVPVWFLPTKTTDQLREEMVTDFDIRSAVASERSISLPPVREIDLGGTDGTEGYILLNDYADREGTTVAYAGDEITEDIANLLAGSGVSSVRACRKGGLDNYISLERYSDSGGGVVLERHDPFTDKAVSGLLNAGVTDVRVRLRSTVEPWMVMETITGPGGEMIAAAGSYLDEAQITACSESGRMSILVAPLTPTEIACAQLCGLGHYRMRGYLEVQTAAGFRAWMDAQEEAQRAAFGMNPEDTGEE